jgi:carbon-monoxide dehydrogenase medium subunit
LEEASSLLCEHGAQARILAGGQSLIPLLAQRALRPRLVIDINRIPGLSEIEVESDFIRMGALVRQEQARVHPVVRVDLGGLSAALGWVASAGIRERGTVVGNLVNNAPGSELPCVAIALGARFTIRDQDGAREVSAASVLGAGAVLPADTLVTHVHWPRAPGRAAFYEVARRHGHAPVVGALVSIGRHGCRVGLCGVGVVGLACPAVARAIFTTLPGVPGAGELAAALALDLGPGVPLLSTAFVGAAYRREVAPVVIQRAAAAAARAATR